MNHMVLRPPGGGSSFSFGVGETQEQPVRRHKMASNIFGVPENDPVPVQRPLETGASTKAECGDMDSAEQRTCPSEEYGDAMEPGKEQSQPAAEPEAPVQPVAPGRRNPPGGRSTLVLG
ncbi:hypothetical protein GDO86_020354 [Hymenochirus boettgeri]|uniref:Hematological and neurological expressed 1 n=1 Tax=Hymenochirus boettgeri TaxID=247094 RepID=A0A8T2IDB1_9PIPI|nr:hypothetical protein GDO86_020354 [Hymenochirus boettgeri]